MSPSFCPTARWPALAMNVLLICTLVACGGTDDIAALPAPALASASPPSVSARAALAGDFGSGTVSAAAAAAPESLAGASSSSNTALGSDGRVLLLGLPARPPAAAPWPAAATGDRSFFVDSRHGDDTNDGRSADRAFRSLARLAGARLGPGDRVVLACGSQWQETLRPAASGTATRPIVIAAPGGCSQPPTIDGSIELPASAWVRQSGSVWRSTLALPPLQLFSDAGSWVPAHHPNRSASGPSYLALAADGNISGSTGAEVSTRLSLGTDLALPPGASLGPGTRVRLRTAAYVIDDLAVASVDGRTLNLAAPTTYPAKAGWGYLLTGQAWMVDSAGEWHHDATSGRLTVHELGGTGTAVLPGSATVLAIGIDLQNQSHVIVDGLLVRKVGTGARLHGGLGLHLRNSRFEDIADRGVDAARSTGVVIESNQIERTGIDAVFGGGMADFAAQGLVVRNNLIRGSGVLMDGPAIRSLPRRSYGAILAGEGASVSGNVIVDSGYIGIRLFERSVADRNVIIGSCTVLDDCGAIYTLGANNGSRISGNLVLHVRGNAAGKPRAARGAQAQGIYIDDFATGVTVEGNTVVDADHGLQLHDASANLVLSNRLYGNRVAQLWLQETRRTAEGGSTLRGNLVEGNQFVPVHPNSRSLLAETLLASASAFGSFDRNRFFDAVPGRMGTVGTAASARNPTLLDWFTTPGLVSPAAADPGGSASSGDGHAVASIAGANVVPNGDLARDGSGWSHYSAAMPQGQLQRTLCSNGPCLRYSGGAPTGLVSSPNFSIEQGRWYRLSIDIATDRDAQPVQLMVRRGGGGSNGYESLADRDLAFVAGTRWRRHSVVFQATRSVRANDPQTADLGARVDLEGIAAGRSLSLANLEIVPITPYAAPRLTLAVVNADDRPVDASCPLPAEQAALCTQLADLADPTGAQDGRRIGWPLRLAPRSALLLRAFEPALVDSDGDGIPDWQDRCPGTASRQAVNAAGCALGQPQ